MKSLRCVLAVLFAFIYVGLNAQVFVGGNVGFSTAGGSIANGGTTTDKPSTINFNVTPMGGKFISEDFTVGISLNLAGSRTSTPGSPETVATSSTIGAAPFVRYYAFRMDKFSVFGQGNVGFSYGSSKSKTGGVTTDGPKSTTLYLNVVPALSYDLNENLSLETAFNILNLGYNLNIVKNGTVKNKTSTFGLGAGLTNLVTVGSISIGAIYKFK